MPPGAPSRDLKTSVTEGRSLARNALWSILGRATPLAIALFAIPILLHGLGPARFGILNLGWLVVGYLNLFDLGLGRALTLAAAERRGSDNEHEIRPLFWKSLTLLVFLGLAGAVIGFGISRLLVFQVLTIEPQLRNESLWVFSLLALSLPMQVSNSGLRGLLEAYQEFRLVGISQIFIGAYSFLAPMALLPFTRSLVPIIVALLIGRAVIWLVYFTQCLRLLPASELPHTGGTVSMRFMFRVGGWMTVSNIAGPLMDTADRFIVGSLLSVAAVSYYTAPFDVVTKLLIIPTALAAVVFPAFATSFTKAPEVAARLVTRSISLTFGLLSPIVLMLVLFARELLTLWLGEEFSRQSTHVLQILALGVLANCVAQLPFALVQGGGRADLTARLHLIEFPLFLVATWMLIRSFGITGAAVGWAVRVVLDCTILLAMMVRMLNHQHPVRGRVVAVGACMVVMALVCLIPMTISQKLITASLIIPAQSYLTFRHLLLEDDRTGLSSLVLHRATWLRRGMVPQ